jgi:hypothetical protein
MKALFLLCVVVLVACASSPGDYAGASRSLACGVSYPQLPPCECGCVGHVCSSGENGVVVCDSDEAQPTIGRERRSALSLSAQ